MIKLDGTFDPKSDYRAYTMGVLKGDQFTTVAKAISLNGGWTADWVNDTYPFMEMHQGEVFDYLSDFKESMQMTIEENVGNILASISNGLCPSKKGIRGCLVCSNTCEAHDFRRAMKELMTRI